MKSYWYVITALSLLPFWGMAQNAKGAALENTTPAPGPGITRAVIVGISKYLEVKPDLQYADRDAEEFASYLQSKSGGGLTADNIKLLTNENATTANIVMALEWLKQQSNTNDKAIIYFSGHGDVEKLTDQQNGYLLTYNSPKQVYIAGALPVYIVKDYVSTLSNKNVSVVLISDACHSGKLAGGQEGVRGANAALQNKWEKEVKILSAQPSQLSLESKDWGNGRGVFSYYLVNGLYGMADQNNDGQVTISELEGYVTQHVVADSRQTQEPFFDASAKYTSIIGKVDDGDKAKVQQQIASASVTAYNPAGGKAGGEALVQSLTPAAQQAYTSFQKAMEEGRLVEPKNNSAQFYLAQLKGFDNKQVSFIAEQNFTAELLNESQLILNKYLEGKKFLRRADFAEGYAKISAALVNVPPTHPLYNSIRAQSLFFQAASQSDMFYDTIVNKKDLQTAIALLDSAKKVLPDAAYIYQIQGEMHYLVGNTQAAIADFEKASELSPKWIYPVYSLGGIYYHKGNKEKAKDYLEKSISIDSTMHTLQCTKCSFKLLGDIYREQKKYNQALNKYAAAISLDSTLSDAYFHAADMLGEQKRYAEAENYANELFKVDSAEAYNALSGIAYYKRDLDAAQEYAEQAVETSPDYSNAYYALGQILKEQGDEEGAADNYYQAILLDPDEADAYQALIEYWDENDMQDSVESFIPQRLPLIKNRDTKVGVYLLMGFHYCQYDKNEAKALEQLEQVLQLGFDDKATLNSVFKPIKANKGYQALLAKYKAMD